MSPHSPVNEPSGNSQSGFDAATYLRARSLEDVIDGDDLVSR